MYQVLAVRRDRLSRYWRGYGHVTRILISSSHIFGIDKARHYKFRVLIDAQEY